MQRREFGQLVERGRDIVVHAHRVAEALAAVHDPVPDRVGVRQLVQRAQQRAFVDPAARRVEVTLAQQLIVVAENAELQRCWTRR